MCKSCVKDLLPNRNTCCLDNGTYFANWNGCGNCGSVVFPKNNDRVVDEDEDGNEEVEFVHRCGDCEHEIATHYYTFSYNETHQEYTMDCFLCGKGVHSVQIQVDDTDEEGNHPVLEGKVAYPSVCAVVDNGPLDGTLVQNQQALASLLGNMTLMPSNPESVGGDGDENDDDEWEED